MSPRGGKRKGAGRPKGEPTRVLSIRVPAKELDACEADAALYGMTIAEYTRRALWNMFHRASWKKRATRG